jgi:hypothetical protein
MTMAATPTGTDGSTTAAVPRRAPERSAAKNRLMPLSEANVCATDDS